MTAEATGHRGFHVAGFLVLFAGLYLARLYSYILFHSLVELFSVVIAVAIFTFAWNTRRYSDNGYFLFLGIAFFHIGVLDLVHTLAYKGMGVFREYDADLPTQLWIAARYLQAVSFVAAPVFLNRIIYPGRTFAVFAAVTTALLFSIFSWRIFPACFVEGSGLTTFKVASEYIISLILLVSAVLPRGKREKFEPAVLRLITAFIFTTIASEMAFTLYVDVYGVSNMIGHFLKVIAFYFIYRAIIVTGLDQPFGILFRDLKQSEEKDRAILESIEDGYHEVDLAGRFTFFNESFRKMLGYPAEELLGLHYKTYAADEENARKVYQAYNRVYRTGEPLDRFEWDIIRKDGSRMTVEVSASLIKGESGEPTGFRGVVRDVTERKASEDAMSRQLRFLQTLMDAIPNPVFYKDREGRYQGCNRAFEEYLGLEKSQIIGRTAYDVAPEELARKYHEMDLDLMERPGMQAYEYRVRYADGTLHDVIINKATYHRSDGSVAGIIGVILDITERKRAEDAIRESERKFSELAHSLPQIVFEADADGNLTFVNSDAYSMSGYTPEDVQKGLNAIQMIVPEERERALSNIRRILMGETLRGNEYTFLRKDGRTFPIIAETVPIVREGRIVGMRGILMNIAERKKLETRLAEAGKMEAVGKLAAGAAHEIRNPLNIMSLSLQMLDLKGKVLDDDVRKTIDTCHAQIGRIIQVLEGLHEFARIPETRKERNDLNKIVEEIIVSQNERLRSENVQVEASYDRDIPPFLLDGGKIALAITHLVSNAVDAMKGREKKKIVISVQKTPGGQSVRITLSDTGRGIKEADRSRIFNPFFTTKDPDKGKGLGLAIVYGIVQEHGGNIWVRNNAEGGATFVIELPIEVNGKQ